MDDDVKTIDEKQVGTIRATVELMLADELTEREAKVDKCLIALAEAVQHVEKTIGRKIALGIERSKVDLG